MAMWQLHFQSYNKSLLGGRNFLGCWGEKRWEADLFAQVIRMCIRKTHGAFSTTEPPFTESPQSQPILTLTYIVSFDGSPAIDFVHLEMIHRTISFPIYSLHINTKYG